MKRDLIFKCGLGYALLLGAICSTALGTDPVTFQSLLKEMPDRALLARWPDPPYVCVQESSHDRTKNDPKNAKTWHSNQDMGQFNRVEENQGRKEWVMMEHEGPGAITRVWLPLYEPANKATIRFYFDASKEPAIAVNFNDLLSGKAFVKPPFAFVSWDQNGIADQAAHPPDRMRGVGGDLYLPIPFAKGCRITLSELPFYYHFGYREYPSGTEVKTFSMADFDASAALIEQAGKALNRAPDVFADSPAMLATLAPGQTLTAALPEGPNAIDRIQVSIDPKTAPQALRSIILVGEFDDQQTIWCPIGDFFGCGARLHKVFDHFRSVGDDGSFLAGWTMPYQHRARITLRNIGKEPVHATLLCPVTHWNWDDRSQYFHAGWHSEHEIKTRPMFDWNYLNVDGRGVYVGDTLTAYSPTAGWYGEGDERIYVDGEKLPSHLGTGTEDYYGYAWGMADYFSSPFLSTPQRDTRGNWRGYTTTSRVRSLDAIPFTRSLQHDMEIWDWDDTKLDYAVAVFWYGAPGATGNLKPNPIEATLELRPLPSDPSARLPGAIECEDMKVADATPGLKSGVQDAGLAGEGHWSSGKQLFVQAQKPGDFITLFVPVSDTAPHKLTLHGTRSFDYGILHFTVNGAAVDKDYDAYFATPDVTGPLSLGTFVPKDGGYLLRVEVKDANAASRGQRVYFGLDCVVLSPG